MTSKGDRIGRLEALLEKIRERSAQPRGLNGVSAGSVAQWAPEDTEIRISTTFDDPETFAAEVAFTGAAVADADGAAAVEEALPEPEGEDGPPRFSDEIVEDGRISDLVTSGRLSAYDDIQDDVQDEPESFPANMLDEYEVSEDVVEIHVDADDDSVRTSVEVSALDVPVAVDLPAMDVPPVDVGPIDLPPVEADPHAVATVELNEVPSGARLAGASGISLSDPDEMIVNESDLERISVGVTVEVEETPSSSRRPIPEESEVAPVSEEPPMTPPPTSGKQVAADYGFDAAAETLHPVGPIESPQRDPLLPTYPEQDEARALENAAEADLDVPRQIWKATSPPPQVEPETFGAWLDATMSL